MFTKYLAIGLKVKDYDKAFTFYKEVLGFSVKTEDKENKFAELQLGNLVIALLTNETVDGMCGLSNLGEASTSSCVIAMEVESVASAYAELSKNGVKFVVAPKTTSWGQQVAYFKDIEGYMWEISEKFEE